MEDSNVQHTHNTARFSLLSVLTVIGLALARTCLAAAQSASASGLIVADEEMVLKLLLGRPASQLEGDVESVTAALAAAESDVGEAERMELVARGRVDVKRRELTLLEDRAKLAERDANATRKGELERQRKKERSQLKVFEAMAETAGQQLKFSVKRREFLQALKKLREAELAAARKHDALADLASASGDRKTVEQENRASTRRAAEALRDYAKEGNDVARSVDNLVSARLRLIDAWAAYKSGD